MSRSPQISLSRILSGWRLHTARRSSIFLQSTAFQRGFCSNQLSPRTCLRRLSLHALVGVRTASTATARLSSTVSAGAAPVVYEGPLTATFRRLKIFSLASFGLSFTLSPFIFIIESNLPMVARVALAVTALSTSGVSTALVAWCGRPYVSTLRRIPPDDNNGVEGIEMNTLTLGLHSRITRVYDPAFLIETRRPFAKWELASTITLPSDTVAQCKSGQEEAVAETMDKNGTIVGRWIVKWGENNQGTCHEVGKVVRYFNVHEELLH